MQHAREGSSRVAAIAEAEATACMRVVDLLQHSCLTVSSASRVPTGWWTFHGANKGKSLPVRGRLRTDDTEAFLQGAWMSLGVVRLASWLVSDKVASGQLVCLFPR